MDSDQQTVLTPHPTAKLSWVQVHLPTILRAGRGLKRRLDAIPLLPGPYSTILLAAMGILAVIAVLLLFGLAFNITIRP
ncbi:MAG: hypothetical protein JXB04_08215 [Kiritimatiellae bacterium]|nr:hypothetical protein [Kiritimatiellia bacterium]